MESRGVIDARELATGNPTSSRVACTERVGGGLFLPVAVERCPPPLITPNLSGGAFILRLSQMADRVEVCLLDLTGRVVKVVEDWEDAVTWDLTSKPGVCLVQVSTPEASLTLVKVIVTE